MKTIIIIISFLTMASCKQTSDNMESTLIQRENELLKQEISFLKEKERFYQDSIATLQEKLKMAITNTNDKTIESKPYLYGVPPAPPFKNIELEITNRVTEGCSKSSKELIGYIIEVIQDKVSDYDLLIQTDQGVKGKYYIETDDMSNAQISWLSYLLIPGNKVKMKVQYCGSGGFTYIMNIKNLKRD